MAAPIDGVLIWGAGGHGKVVADLLRASGRRIAGYVDADPAKLGSLAEPGGSCVVMLEQELLRTDNVGFDHLGGGIAIAIGDNLARDRCRRKIPEAHLVTLIHPSAAVSPSASIGRGTVIFPGAIVNADAQLGAAVIVNSGAVVEHDCELSDSVHVAPGATLGGGVRVGLRSWIGAGAVILPGVQIGSNVTVGAGAVVLRDLSDGITVVGNPATILRRPSE